MWKTVKLGDICDISIGKTPSRGEKRFWDREKKTDNVWLSIADLTSVNGKYISDSKEYVSDEGARLFSPVLPNTLVMSFKLSIGKLAFTQRELRTNEAIAALPIKNESLVSKEFLYHYLSSMNWNTIAGNDEKVKGKTLNKKKLNSLEVVLPPLAEQQRIVAKLDAAFAEIDRAIEVAESKHAEVEKLKAALLSSLLRGEDWETVKLGNICDVSIGKTPSRAERRFWDKEKKTDNVWLSIADLTSAKGKYISDSKEYVSNEGAQLFKPVPPETLIMSFKLSIGKLAFTKCEVRTNEAIAALPLKDSSLVSKEYLYHYLSSMNWDIIAGNDEKVKGKTLNKKKLNSLEVVLPPLAEQQRIVAKLDAAFAELDRAQASVSETKAHYQALKSAILAQELQPPQSEAA